MEKPINYFWEDTPENREMMNKALEEYNRIFKNSGCYLFTSAKKDSNELQVH